MNYEISVAIDFGTSNCAVAYSYESDKQNVIVINDWQDGVETRGKIPTAMQLTNIGSMWLMKCKMNFTSFNISRWNCTTKRFAMLLMFAQKSNFANI